VIEPRPDVSANGVRKSGYVLNVGPGTVATIIISSANTCNGSVDDALASYFSEAHPASVGSTGQRSFGMDQRGTIYQDISGATFTNTFPASASPIQ
jgi:hypothetical protein